MCVYSVVSFLIIFLSFLRVSYTPHTLPRHVMSSTHSVMRAADNNGRVNIPVITWFISCATKSSDPIEWQSSVIVGLCIYVVDDRSLWFTRGWARSILPKHLFCVVCHFCIWNMAAVAGLSRKNTKIHRIKSTCNRRFCLTAAVRMKIPVVLLPRERGRRDREGTVMNIITVMNISLWPCLCNVLTIKSWTCVMLVCITWEKCL